MNYESVSYDFTDLSTLICFGMDPENFTVNMSSSLVERPRLAPGLVIRLVIYVLLGVSIVVCNAAVIATYWLVKAVRVDVGNAFIVNIAYADFLVGLFNIPNIFLEDYFYGRWMFGEIFCKLTLTVAYLDTFVPVVIIVLLMSYRILMMSRSAKTRALVKRRHVTILMTSLWVLFFLFYLFIAFGIPIICGGNLVDYSKQCHMEYLFVPSAVIAMMIIEFLVPVILILSLGIALVVGIRKMTLRMNVIHPAPSTNRTRNTTSIRVGRNEWTQSTSGAHLQSTQSTGLSFSRQTQALEGMEGECVPSGSAGSPTVCPAAHLPSPDTDRPVCAVTTAYATCEPTCEQGMPSAMPRPRDHDNFATVQPARNRQSMMVPPTSLVQPHERDQQEIEQVRSMRGHRKGAIRVLILVSAYIACWMPFVITLVINAACYDCLPRDVIIAVHIVVICNSIVNPFLYAGTNNRFRKGFAKLLHIPIRPE